MSNRKELEPSKHKQGDIVLVEAKADSARSRSGLTPPQPTNLIRVKTGDFAGVIGRITAIEDDSEYPIHVRFLNGETNQYYLEQVEPVDMSQLSDFERDQVIHCSFFQNAIGLNT